MTTPFFERDERRENTTTNGVVFSTLVVLCRLRKPFAWETDLRSGGRLLHSGDRRTPKLVLEPTTFPPAKTYQAALFEAAIPLTALATDDIDAECRRLTARGVVFRGEPQESGSAKSVMFEDTCGNLINLYQVL